MVLVVPIVRMHVSPHLSTNVNVAFSKFVFVDVCNYSTTHIEHCVVVMLAPSVTPLQHRFLSGIVVKPYLP